MNTVFVDDKMDDRERREQLYQGQLFVFSPTKSSQAFCAFARELAAEAFAPHNPEEAQYYLPVEKYVEILATLKPRFIHHAKCKELIREVFTDLVCVFTKNSFDVTRLRTMPH